MSFPFTSKAPSIGKIKSRRRRRRRRYNSLKVREDLSLHFFVCFRDIASLFFSLSEFPRLRPPESSRPFAAPSLSPPITNHFSAKLPKSEDSTTDADSTAEVKLEVKGVERMKRICKLVGSFARKNLFYPDLTTTAPSRDDVWRWLWQSAGGMDRPRAPLARYVRLRYPPIPSFVVIQCRLGQPTES